MHHAPSRDRPVAVVMALGMMASLLAPLLAPVRAHAFCRMTTEMPAAGASCSPPADPDGNPPTFFLEWRRPCTSIALSLFRVAGSGELRLSKSLDEGTVRQALRRALNTWQEVTCGGQATGVEITILSQLATCSEPEARVSGPNVSTLIFRTDWAEAGYDPTAFALTTVWHRPSTGEIFDVDIEMNETNNTFEVCPVAGCSRGAAARVDLEATLAHEIGHYFGLGHTSDELATMYYRAQRGSTTKRDLEPDDIAGFCNVYPPGSLPSECDATPFGGLRLDCGPEGCCALAPGLACRRIPSGLLAMLLLAGLAWVRRRAVCPKPTDRSSSRPA